MIVKSPYTYIMHCMRSTAASPAASRLFGSTRVMGG